MDLTTDFEMWKVYSKESQMARKKMTAIVLVLWIICQSVGDYSWVAMKEMASE